MSNEKMTFNKHFIINRVLELIAAPILVGIGYALIAPIIIMLLNLLVPLSDIR